MIQLNYPEMLQDIKMSIFSGDHSGIYSLACAVACIATSFSLITWYNKMMNDPFGRLDVRSVVRTVMVLFLTCNFYSFVLMPLDGITHTVAKAITASVDSDRDGVFGKINELYAAVEEHDKESLTGQFEEEMGRESSSTDLDGLSYETSAIAESIVESAIEKGEKPGFFKRLWSGVKGFVSAKIGQAVNNLGSILSALLSIIVKLVQYVLYAVSSVYLIILGLIGPFAFALSLMPGFQNNIRTWLARYIQISFWIPVTAFVDMVNIKIKGAMVSAMWNAAFIERFAYPIHLIVFDVVTLVCLLGVPSLASWVITSAGASDVNRNIAQTAQKAAMLAGK